MSKRRKETIVSEKTSIERQGGRNAFGKTISPCGFQSAAVEEIRIRFGGHWHNGLFGGLSKKGKGGRNTKTKQIDIIEADRGRFFMEKK